MLAINLIYQGIEKFKISVEENHVDVYSNCLICIYTPVFDHEMALNTATDIKKLLPNSQIVGATANGVIFNGKTYDDETIVIIQKYEKAKIVSNLIDWENKTCSKLVDKILDEVKSIKPNMIHILFGGIFSDGIEFVEEFNNRNTDIQLVGGIAGQTSAKDHTPFVFNEKEVVINGIITYAISSDAYTYCAINSSTEKISSTFTVTRADGVYWDEIDNIPAVEWFKKYLGIQTLRDYSEIVDVVTYDPLICFSAVIEGKKHSKIFLKYVAEEKRMSQYSSKSPEGTKFTVGYTSSAKCVEMCGDICEDIINHPIEQLFCYSCYFRKTYLSSCAEWELTPFAKQNVCGVFLLGEIAYSAENNEFLNGAHVLTGVAEQQVYIKPDVSVFNRLYEIEDETKEFLTLVLKNQSLAVSEENKMLLDKLVEQQNEIQAQLMMDRRLAIPNWRKFNQDNETEHFNKLCMLRIYNSAIMIAHLGFEEYFEAFRKMMKKIENYMKENDFIKNIHFYAVNDDSIIMTANNQVDSETFTNIAKKIYKKYQLVKLDEISISVVNRFALILNEKEMIKNAMTLFQLDTKNHFNFILGDPDKEYSNYSAEELEIINIIETALENNGIIPYYQGIHNNKSKIIEKCEALMRIVDEDGKVYAPFVFMDIAKKYHLYLKMSKRLLSRVFEDFGEGKIPMDVSVNLSAIDINQESVRNWLYSKLEKVKNPSSFIFEVVEGDEFKNKEILTEFIGKIHEYGAKIAIDDFGSGYSNLLEIANTAPDYIKIDGSIVKGAFVHQNSKVILKTIVYMAKNLGVELIAEFVENEEIQNLIDELGIYYSQGYYFAKPEDIDYIKREKI